MARKIQSHCDLEVYRKGFDAADEVLGTIVGMINHPETWLLG